MNASGIQIKPSHIGRLHAAMGVPMKKKLSLGDLMATKEKAKKTGNTALEKQATFAQNARSWGGKG